MTDWKIQLKSPSKHSHLAGVLATSIKTSTDHGVSNVILTIGVTAVIIRDNGDIDLRMMMGYKNDVTMMMSIPSSGF